MQIIAIAGAKGAGKSTVGNILVQDYGFVRMRFADTIKRMLKAMGLTDVEIDGALKEQPCARLNGKTPRHALTSLGTGWGRKMISDTIWTDITGADIDSACAANPDIKIVIDDLRHPSEFALLERLGADRWLVRRPDIEPAQNTWLTILLSWFGLRTRLHDSETHWPKYPYHAVFFNISDPATLVDKVHRAMSHIRQN